MKHKKAFTLIELLVVIGIIAVLMSIMLPSLAKARQLAQRSLCGNNLRQIFLATDMYAQDNNHFFPSTTDPIGDTTVWLWMGRGFRGFVKPYLDNQEGRTSVLCCPGDKTATNKYEATSYAYSMSFYHSTAQINQMTSVAHTYGTNSLPSIPQRLTEVVRPSKKIIYGEWLSNHQEIDNDSGWWVWSGARNFVLADGHIEFVEAVDIITANDGLPNPNLTKDGIKGFDLQ